MTRTFIIARACKCGNDRMSIGQAMSTRGDVIYPFVCVECNAVQQQYAKKSVALGEKAANGGTLPEVKTRTQQMPAKFEAMRADVQARKCEVCGDGPAQFHHWAPYHLFGAEAEKWPVGLLCQACHTRWHQIVTPNMGQHS